MGPEPLRLPGGGSGGRLGPRHSGPVATLCGDMKPSHTPVPKPHRRCSTFFAALQTVSYPSAILGFMPCRDVGGLWPPKEIELQENSAEPSCGELVAEFAMAGPCS